MNTYGVLVHNNTITNSFNNIGFHIRAPFPYNSSLDTLSCVITNNTIQVKGESSSGSYNNEPYGVLLVTGTTPLSFFRIEGRYIQQRY